MRRRRNTSPKRAQGKAQRVRIIAGRWRGRLLEVVDVPGLRPSTDRVRETLFNWLQPRLPGARCLDLFAGSGALGFEAASRAAAQVWMVEYSAEVMQGLQAAKQGLQAQEVDLVQADALSWLLDQEARLSTVDVVFLDPPYRQGLLQKAVDALAQRPAPASGQAIYFEHAADEPAVVWPAGWVISRCKRAGQLVYGLVERS